MKGGLPLVYAEGKPYDVGLTHGVEARELVAHNAQLYLRRFAQVGGIDRAEIRRRANAYREVIEEANPLYAQEMAGIADGSRQDPLDIVGINVRYEILYTEYVRKAMEQAASQPEVSGCTALAVVPARTSNGHLLMAQNWDWIPEVEGIIVHARREGQPESLGFTEAGIAGAKIGVNAAGIGLAINGLMTDRDAWSRLLKPFHVRCWEILGARTLGEATRAVVDTKRACSANFLLGRSGGGRTEIVDLEAATEAEHRLAPAEGFLVHTNHFLNPEALGIVQPLGEDRVSTFHRFDRAQSFLRETLARGPIGIEDLSRILADHDGEPDSVCRHVITAKPEHERYATVVSAIIDVDAHQLYVAPGNPCVAEYRRYSMAG